MNDIKVSLTIVLKGSTMLSEQECSKNPKESYDYNTLVVEDPKTKKRETLHYQTRKCENARQSIQMTKEAYNYMIDKSACPEWEKMFFWTKMSKKQRLESHLKRTMEYFGGISFSYEVFED